MSSQRRIDCSRANGAKSRGPVTPEGRACSRVARLTHGLTSDQLVIAGETEEEFNAFREEYLADYQPQTRSQVDLVDHLVATRWRLNMDVQMARQQPGIDEEFESCDAKTRAAIACEHLCDDSRGLESLHRHEARLSAELRRTLKLQDAQLKNQKLHDEPNPAKPPHSDEDGDDRQAPPSAIDHPPSTAEKPRGSHRPSTIHHRPAILAYGSGDRMPTAMRSNTRWVATCSMALVWMSLAGPARAQNWQVVWSDEFNGAQGTLPDPTKWAYDNPYVGSNNAEQEIYCGLAGPGQTGICANWQQNAQMDGQGHLVIQAVNNGQGWTSARLLTQGIFSFTYGRVEASIKLPSGVGTWPAFWLLGNSIDTVGWPACGEVDIMENVLALGPTKTQSTIHGTGYNEPSGIWHQYNFPTGQEIDTAYHVYGMIWSQNQIQFYVDDYTAPFATVNPSSIPGGTSWLFNNPFFMILNLAMGGSWPGPTNNTTPNPSLMLVDYVRVYAVAPVGLSMTHTGNFTQGQTGATYTVTVSNDASAPATSGTVTVTETVPAGLTLVSMAGTGWSCSNNTCTRSDALNPGSSFPPITVTVNVASNAATQVTNQVTASVGSSTVQASASDVTTIAPVVVPPAPVLSSPANGATGVSVTPTLTWTASGGATSYDVYFGTLAAPSLLTTVTGTSYSPAGLNPETLYYWQIIARNSAGTASSATWSFTTGARSGALRFVPVTPCRVVDTRQANGAFGGPTMTDNSSRSFTIPQSSCGIPATAQAYSLNVTVVPKGPLPYLTLWPTGQPQAFVSTLNSFAGNVVANAAIVPAGTNGAVSVYVTDATDVILDINGYFDTPGAATSYSFYPATPCRVADTRGTTSQFGGPSMTSGQERDFPIPLSSCSISATARAYSLNVTVVPAGYLGYLTTWPTGDAQPNVSTLNSWTGKVVANAALVPSGTNESISVFVSNPTDVILDINGYFGQPGSQGALFFYPVTPCRVADTRNPNGAFGGPKMAAQTSRSFVIPASACGIPATAAAYSMNVTVVPDSTLSYLTAWPTGSSQPLVSTLNSFDGSVVANAAIVPAGTGGAISIYVTHPTQVILDINGYFAP